MKAQHDNESEAIAAKLRSGEYFAEARMWYSDLHHTILSQRNWALVIASLSLFILLVSCSAWMSLLPLSEPRPIIITSENVQDEVARISRLQIGQEAPNFALMRFMLGHYVEAREGYDVEKLSAGLAYVRENSSEAEFRAYQNFLNPQNPLSPLSLYQRHTFRRIQVNDVQLFVQQVPYRARVTFGAYTVGQAQTPLRTLVADIAFRYTPVEVNQDTGETSQMQFQVESYRVSEGGGQ